MTFIRTVITSGVAAILLYSSIEPAYPASDQQRSSTHDEVRLRTTLTNSLEEMSPGSKLEHEANQYYAKGDFRNAIKLLRKSVLEAKKEGLDDNRLYGLYNSLSNFALEGKDWEAHYEALSGKAEIIRKRNNLPTLGYELILLSGAELQTGNYEKSVEQLTVVIESLEKSTGSRSHDLILPYLLLGACHFESKNYPKAKEIFSKITGLSFDNVSATDLSIAQLFISLISERAGEPGVASQDYEQALKYLTSKAIERNPYEILHKSLLYSFTKKRLEFLESVKKKRRD